jgi:regulator of cell morphogenesis and NO signaling
MSVTPTKRLADLALEVPNAITLFEELGFDYCCGGDQTLKDACTAAGLSIRKVQRSLIAASEKATHEPLIDWRKEPLERLTTFIVGKHHNVTRAHLVRLSRLMLKAIRIHVRQHPELPAIHASFERISEDLEAHMKEEEEVLFPYIGLLEKAIASNTPIANRSMRDAGHLIMVEEHDLEEHRLREIRTLAGRYRSAAAEGCCYEEIYRNLRLFERDLHEHIHLENNVLFPRTVKLERQVIRTYLDH